jgi:AcrR family transcriptional regulator
VAAPDKEVRAQRARMTGAERRHQLIDIARTLFAERGYDGTSIEEIALRANVSKPVVYEHFGGKEGLYAVVVDREMSALLDGVTSSLTRTTNNRSRLRIERVALALLTPLYAQALVGSVSMTAQWWLDVREPRKEVVAAHLVNLCWNGLMHLEDDPQLLDE